MKRTIKIFLSGIIATFISGAFVLVPHVFAFEPNQEVCNVPGATNTTFCQSNTQTQNPLYGSNGLITKGVNILSLFTGIAAVICIIIGGFLYVLSNGDASRINKAKDTILYAVVGLVIVAIAQSIVRVVLVNIK